MAKANKVKRKGSTVLVSGAAGSLGVHLVRGLSAAGWRVRAWDRQGPRETLRNSLVEGLKGVDWIEAEGLESFRDAVKGCDAVVHAAGLVSLSESEADLRAANLELTQALFEASRQAGVDHFVHISCAFVYLAEGEVRTEESPVGAYNDFERSKLDAERALQGKAHEEGAPALTILRPGLLYGPGCTQMGAGVATLPAILREFSGYLPGLSGGPRTNWCHVEDAAQAVVVVLKSEASHGRIFNVADETALSFGEVVTSVMEAYGIDLGPSVPMPSVALWALLIPIIDNDWAFGKVRGGLRLLWRRMQREHGLESPLTPRLNRNALFYVRDDAVVVADALRGLGWAPKWPDFRQGIAATIRWYQAEGWAPRFDLESVAERRDERLVRQFHYQEHLTGVIAAEEEGRRFEASWTTAWESIPWPPFAREALIEGTIALEEIAADAPLKGTARLNWFPTPRIRYEFGFVDDAGRARRFEGLRRLDRASPTTSWKEIAGEFIDHHGELTGTASGRFVDHNSPRLTSEMRSKL